MWSPDSKGLLSPQEQEQETEEGHEGTKGGWPSVAKEKDQSYRHLDPELPAFAPERKSSWLPTLW